MDGNKKSTGTKGKTKKEKTSLNDIILAGIERGLTIQDIRKMTLGQVVDFCIDYNERQERAERAAKHPKSKKRKATQADIDAFFGG